MKQTTNKNILEEIYTKNASFEKARNTIENALNITVKNKSDILRASALSFISNNFKDRKEVLEISKNVGALTKSQVKTLTVGDLM